MANARCSGLRQLTLDRVKKRVPRYGAGIYRMTELRIRVSIAVALVVVSFVVAGTTGQTVATCKIGALFQGGNWPCRVFLPFWYLGSAGMATLAVMAAPRLMAKARARMDYVRKHQERNGR